MCSVAGRIALAPVRGFLSLLRRGDFAARMRRGCSQNWGPWQRTCKDPTRVINHADPKLAQQHRCPEAASFRKLVLS